MADGPSRIAEARRRAADAKQTALLAAAAGFIALLLLARVSHPGHAATGVNAATPLQTSQQQDDGFSLSPGTLGQGSGGQGSGGVVQTSVS